MIVVAIIGILAAIALPQYQNYTARANGASAVSSLASAKQQVGMNANDGATNLCSNTAGLLPKGASCTAGSLTSASVGSSEALATTVTLTVDTSQNITQWKCTVSNEKAATSSCTYTAPTVP